MDPFYGEKFSRWVGSGMAGSPMDSSFQPAPVVTGPVSRRSPPIHGLRRAGTAIRSAHPCCRATRSLGPSIHHRAGPVPRRRHGAAGSRRPGFQGPGTAQSQPVPRPRRRAPAAPPFRRASMSVPGLAVAPGRRAAAANPGAVRKWAAARSPVLRPWLTPWQDRRRGGQPLT